MRSPSCTLLFCNIITRVLTSNIKSCVCRCYHQGDEVYTSFTSQLCSIVSHSWGERQCTGSCEYCVLVTSCWVCTAGHIALYLCLTLTCPLYVPCDDCSRTTGWGRSTGECAGLVQVNILSAFSVQFDIVWWNWNESISCSCKAQIPIMAIAFSFGELTQEAQMGLISLTRVTINIMTREWNQTQQHAPYVIAIHLVCC